MELKYNQFEVKATRKELEGQKEQMIEQNKTLKQQRFENTFFQMVNLHHQIVNSIDLPHPVNLKSRVCFRHFYDSFKKSMDQRDKAINFTLSTYLTIFHRNQSDLGHYFRNLYTISKFIHQSDSEDKQKYFGILRAQLSSHEQLLLFYNCLSTYGEKKFKPLVEKYQLLKNVPFEGLVIIEHKSLYKPNAYGEEESNEKETGSEIS